MASPSVGSVEQHDMSVAEPQPAVPKANRRWFQYSLAALLVLVTICAIIMGCWQWLRGPIHSLPQPDDVLGMKVLWFFDGHRDWPGIEVSQKHWNDIFAALSPSEYDRSPSNWQVLAEIEIHTKQNEDFWLGAYNLAPEPIGAFSIGRTHMERTYRRGGNSARLKEALEKAYAESETQKKAAAISQ